MYIVVSSNIIFCRKIEDDSNNEQNERNFAHGFCYIPEISLDIFSDIVISLLPGDIFYLCVYTLPFFNDL